MVVTDPDLKQGLADLYAPEWARFAIGYEERGVLDRTAQRYRLEVTPRSLASKMTVQGELFTTPIDERSCRRTYLARVEARVFGLAGLIEDRLLDDIEKSYAKSAAFTNRWIADHKL